MMSSERAACLPPEQAHVGAYGIDGAAGVDQSMSSRHRVNRSTV